MDRNADTPAPNAVPKSDVSTSLIDEEQLAHTVESTLKDEPESNEALLSAPVVLLLIMLVSLTEQEK